VLQNNKILKLTLLLEEDGRPSVGQEIFSYGPGSSLAWYKILILVPSLSRLNPVYTLTLYVSKIRSNLTFPSTPISPKWSLSFRIFHEFLTSFMHAECSIHLILFDLIDLIIFSEECTLWHTPACNFYLPPPRPSLTFNSEVLLEIGTAVHDRQLLRRLCEAYCLTDYCRPQRSDLDEIFTWRLMRNYWII
jgi:hypothetical protein